MRASRDLRDQLLVLLYNLRVCKKRSATCSKLTLTCTPSFTNRFTISAPVRPVAPATSATMFLHHKRHRSCSGLR